MITHPKLLLPSVPDNMRDVYARLPVDASEFEVGQPGWSTAQGTLSGDESSPLDGSRSLVLTANVNASYALASYSSAFIPTSRLVAQYRAVANTGAEIVQLEFGIGGARYVVPMVADGSLRKVYVSEENSNRGNSKGVLGFTLAGGSLLAGDTLKIDNVQVWQELPRGSAVHSPVRSAVQPVTL